MESTNLLIDIQASYNQFTKAEKKIADYVLKNPGEILFMSITDLSDSCSVADASVHRFCRTMGLKGYQEFKMKLSISMHENGGMEQNQKNKVQNIDSLEGLAEHIMNISTTVLQETFMLLKKSQVEEAVNMLQEAKRVYFFGIGDSLLTAEEARNKFLRITGKVQCITDPHMQAMAAAMTSAEDLIFIVSYSGATKDNIQVAQIAKEAGAKIVAITRFVKSPLTAFADAILLCGSNEGPLEGGSMGAKLSQLYMIDILFQEYYRRNAEEAGRNNKNTSRAVVEKLY